MFVSIILPVFNTEQYIGIAIESILSQSHKNFELIVINDGSTDRSTEIISKYKEDDKRIIVINKDNSGIVDSLNRGILAAQSNIIIRMDADDIALPNRIADLLAHQQKTQASIVYSNISLIDKFGKHICNGFMPCESDVLKLLEVNNFIAHPTVLFLKDAINGIGNYTNLRPYAEDLDLWLRARENGLIFSYCNSNLLKYRINPNSSRPGIYPSYWYDVARTCMLNNDRRAALRYIKHLTFNQKLKIIIKYFLPFRFHVRNLKLSNLSLKSSS